VLPKLYGFLPRGGAIAEHEATVEVLMQAARQEAVLLTACWTQLGKGDVDRFDSLLGELEAGLSARPDLAEPVAYEIWEAFYLPHIRSTRSPELQPRIDRLKAMRQGARERIREPGSPSG
jgi:hypothetical protein